MAAPDLSKTEATTASAPCSAVDAAGLAAEGGGTDFLGGGFGGADIPQRRQLEWGGRAALQGPTPGGGAFKHTSAPSTA